jgi:hypothetical protein
MKTLLILALLLIPTLGFGASLNLTWEDNATTEDGYVVERSVTNTGPWNEVATLPLDSTSWSDTTVVPEVTYCYRVSATLGAMKSDPSNVSCDKAPLEKATGLTTKRGE